MQNIISGLKVIISMQDEKNIQIKQTVIKAMMTQLRQSLYGKSQIWLPSFMHHWWTIQEIISNHLSNNISCLSSCLATAHCPSMKRPKPRHYNITWITLKLIPLEVTFKYMMKNVQGIMLTQMHFQRFSQAVSLAIAAVPLAGHVAQPTLSF